MAMEPVVDMSAVLQRIDQQQERLKMTDRAISLRAKMSGDGIRNWRRSVARGENPNTTDTKLDNLAEALGVSPKWLRYGGNEPVLTFPSGENDTLYGPGARGRLIHVPTFKLSSTLNEDGKIADEPVYNLAFPQSYLHQLATNGPAELMLVQNEGGTMAPVLNDNDTVLVDMASTDPSREGIYLLRFRGVMQFKRIFINPASDQLRVQSDADEKASFDVPPEKLDVVGRAVWVGHKL